MSNEALIQVARTLQGGSEPIPVVTGTPVHGNFRLLMAGANGCTIASLTGLTNNFSGFELAPAQQLPFGDGIVTDINLSTGSAIAFTR